MKIKTEDEEEEPEASNALVLPDRTRIRTRPNLRVLLKCFFDSFRGSLQRYIKDPKKYPYPLPEWPADFIEQRTLAEQRLHDPNSVLASYVKSFNVFIHTPMWTTVRQVRDPIKYFLIILRMIQDDLYSILGADGQLFQQDNLTILEVIADSIKGANMVTRIVLYEDLVEKTPSECTIMKHGAPKGSEAIVLGCPLRHTFCMQCSLEWLKTLGTRAFRQCPGCTELVADTGSWHPDIRA